LNDCYFLSALSALAEFPEKIRNLFLTQEVNFAGIYEMEFFIAGEFTSVVVDDYIPVKNGKPIFCRTQENELWAILLEKAFAKLHGNYGATEGGKSGMALHILTG
jgi:hypothetical protein